RLQITGILQRSGIDSVKPRIGDEFCHRGFGGAMVAAVKHCRRRVSKMMCARMKHSGKDCVERFDHKCTRNEFADLFCSGACHAHFEARGTQRIYTTDECFTSARPGVAPGVPNDMPRTCQQKDISEASRFLRCAGSSAGFFRKLP